MKKNPLEILEIEEQLKKLNESGFDKLIDLILSNENLVYTKKGRINKSGVCRLLNMKPKQLEEFFEKCRNVLEKNKNN